MSDSANILRRLPPDNKATWGAYWATQEQAWRTEPEISEGRQAELAQRLQRTPDVTQGLYPFSNMKLSRADIEWLLARQNVSRNDGEQQRQEGLDLRGADLRHRDLRNLPLAGLIGEITPHEWLKHHDLTEEQRAMAIVHLEDANLRGAHLERSRLGWARLDKADLRHTHLEDASLVGAHLEGANLGNAHLERANFSGAHLKGAYLWKTHLEDVNLRSAYLDGAFLGDLLLANNEHVGPRLVDVRWGDVNLAIINWSQIYILGDESEISKKQKSHQVQKKHLLYQYEEAVRANRQLAIALVAHGLAEDASRFAYRAQCLQRDVLRLQKKAGQYFFSWLLDILAGYGYRPGRCLTIYLLVIILFATAYAALGRGFLPHLSPLAAIVLSLSSFHGRGFFPSAIPLDSPLSLLAAIEAVVGLLVEIAFITTFTQRFFNKYGS